MVIEVGIWSHGGRGWSMTTLWFRVITDKMVVEIGL